MLRCNGVTAAKYQSKHSGKAFSDQVNMNSQPQQQKQYKIQQQQQQQQ